MSDARLAEACARWGLTVPELVADTRSSRVWRVRHAGSSAALKCLKPEGDDERPGGALLAWWGGDGAVRLRARDGGDMLLDWVEGPLLGARVRAEGDGDSFGIFAGVLEVLHRPRAAPMPFLTSLEARLEPLLRTESRAASIARGLLSSQPEVIPLHGDLHHDNVIETASGPVVIDSKGVLGDPGYDSANLFRNIQDLPDMVCDPARIERLADVLSTSPSDRARRLGWAVAQAALSHCWSRGRADEDVLNPRLLPMLLSAFDRARALAPDAVAL